MSDIRSNSVWGDGNALLGLQGVGQLCRIRKRTYIQSAYAMLTEEKTEIELRPFSLTGDSFPKVLVRRDIGKRWYDDYGVLHINLIDFLLDKAVI